MNIKTRLIETLNQMLDAYYHGQFRGYKDARGEKIKELIDILNDCAIIPIKAVDNNSPMTSRDDRSNGVGEKITIFERKFSVTSCLTVVQKDLTYLKDESDAIKKRLLESLCGFMNDGMENDESNR